MANSAKTAKKSPKIKKCSKTKILIFWENPQFFTSWWEGLPSRIAFCTLGRIWSRKACLAKWGCCDLEKLTLKKHSPILQHGLNITPAEVPQLIQDLVRLRVLHSKPITTIMFISKVISVPLPAFDPYLCFLLAFLFPVGPGLLGQRIHSHSESVVNQNLKPGKTKARGSKENTIRNRRQERTHL